MVSDVEQRVRSVIAKVLKVDRDEISRGSRFTEDLMAKSFDIIEIIAMLEDEFGIEIDDSKARRNRTVGEAIDYIEELTAG
jgi:acyl carrier protein